MFSLIPPYSSLIKIITMLSIFYWMYATLFLSGSEFAIGCAEKGGAGSLGAESLVPLS